MSSKPRSKAHLVFQDRVREVIQLLRLCDLESTPATPQKRRTDEALCRAAVVLLSSHMEGFFEDLVKDALQFHELNKTKISLLPLRLRLLQLRKALDLVDRGADERSWQNVTLIRESLFSDESKFCAIGAIDLECHTAGFANPGSNEVKDLLYSVGIPDIWTIILARKPGNVVLRGSLDALVSRRNPIAHGDAGAKATVKDVIGYLKDMRRLVTEFDEVTSEQLSKISGLPDPWAILPA